jgi:DNA replication and repair protein RecF
VRITRVLLRDFRNIERAELEPAAGLTVVTGPNGAGKTNLLEAIYFGCTARSVRASNERELVRRGSRATRVEVDVEEEEKGAHRLAVGFEPSEAKRITVDGAPVDSLLSSPVRPLVSVFLPERLELVKGAPAARRAHLDRLVAALWPARAEARSAYSRALAQRNALLSRVGAGAAGTSTLDTWDRELAACGLRLMEARGEALDALAPRFAARAADLGLPAEAEVAYRPRSGASDPAQLEEELRDRRQADLDRGFTAHGPHRDELRLTHAGEPLRAYGSQGQQRTAVLALLFAERDLLRERVQRAPLMLLDDVMSELDSARRELLAELLRDGGQAVVTATDRAHVPLPASARDVLVVEAMAGRLSASPQEVRT